MSQSTLLSREESLLLVVDLQEKLFPSIAQKEEILKNTRLLLEGARILSVPVLVSEQYPKGLGPTLDELQDLIPRSMGPGKLTFSCAREPTYQSAVLESGRKQIVLCGIETHVCVLQTALDLAEQGFQCHVVADAVGSRSSKNRETALARMRREGIIITCAESVLFEWMKASGTEEFRHVSKLLK